MRRWRVLLGMGLLILAPAMALAAGEAEGVSATAPATQPAGITNHDFRRALLDYNRRTLTIAYEQIGKRDPKWDADAIAFLDAVALRFSNGGIDQFYHLPGQKPLNDLVAMGRRVREKGCDDPLVNYCYAAVLHDSGQIAEADAIYAKACNGLMDSHYPITRAMYAAGRQFGMARGEQAEDAAWIKFRDTIVTMMSTWQFKNLDRRVILMHLDEYLNNVATSRKEDLVDAAHAVPTVDPWMRDMLEGQTEIKAAWDARGNGWANTVSDQGWRLFYAHLSKARDALTAAWKRHPEYPEAPCEMITVAMAAGPEFGEDLRTWFDRAVKAQFDYLPAYSAYEYALLPRWSGNVPMMQAFATECLKTGRFDTLVPWQYISTVEQIVRNGGVTTSYWQTPGVYESVREVCQGYVKALPPGDQRRFYQDYQAAAAWRTGNYDDAVKALDALGKNAPTSPFKRFSVMPRLAMSHAYAMADAQSAQSIQQGELQAAGGQLDQAIATYEGAVKTAGGAPSGHYLRCRLQQLQWRKQFEKGDWVDIKPSTNELVGWEAEAGAWRVDSDGTLAAREDDGLMLTFQGIFMPPRYEVDVVFEFPRSNAPLEFGMSLMPNDPDIFKGWTVQKTSDKSIIHFGWSTAEWDRDVPVKPGQNTLRLRNWDDKVKIDVNDYSYPRLRGMDQVLKGPKIYLAIGGRLPAGQEIRISSIRLRKLTKEPPKE